VEYNRGIFCRSTTNPFSCGSSVFPKGGPFPFAPFRSSFPYLSLFAVFRAAIFLFPVENVLMLWNGQQTSLSRGMVRYCERKRAGLL
jgi:hypothetical protein